MSLSKGVVYFIQPIENIINMVNVLKFRKLVAWQIGIDKQSRPMKMQSDQGLPCLLFRRAFCDFHS